MPAGFSPKKSEILFLLALSLAAAFLYTGLYSRFRNTLEYNQHWESTKVGLQRPVNGAVAFHITPVALAENRLNLGAWFGFQEVLLKQKVRPQQIDFDLLLPEGGYLSFVYNKGDSGFSGMRFSRSAAFPSMHFLANTSGKFLQKDVLEIQDFDKHSNQLRGVWGEKEISFYLNGRLLGSFPETFLPEQQLGFRGGSSTASVDSMVLKIKDPPGVVEETFGSFQNFWKEFPKFLAAILLLNGLTLAWFRRRPKFSYYAISMNLVLLVIAVPFYFLNYSALSNTYIFSKLYFKALTLNKSYQTRIETQSDAVARLGRQYPASEAKHPPRVLFLGSSQTWGAGAFSYEDTFVRRLEKSWQDKSGPRIEFINGAISGAKSGVLWELYSENWIHWDPRLVVLNLSNNDKSPELFMSNLKKFAELNRAKNIPTIFSLEANAPEAVRSNTLKNHEVMRQVAAEFGIPVVDLNACLEKQQDAGFLWWDFSHLTSFGQELAADCLRAPLTPLLAASLKD